MLQTCLPCIPAFLRRFLWQVQYLVAQGFYVLLDFASHRSEELNMQQPQLLAANWAALWRMLTELPGYQQHLAGRVFPDLVNEPRWAGIHIMILLLGCAAVQHSSAGLCL
jgi:hypothetical protein